MATLGDLCRVVGGELRGPSDLVLTGVGSLSGAGAREIAPVDSDRFVREAEASGAGALLVDPRVSAKFDRPCVVADAPLVALNAIMEFFGLVTPRPPAGIHPTAVIDPTATVPASCTIDPYVVIGAGARIGERCIVRSHVVVERGVVLGDDCVIEAGARLHEGLTAGARVRIGTNAVVCRIGFGYAPKDGAPVLLHHVGTVVLEDDVHIGACTTIDRARFDETRVGRFTAIDSHVHLGHNATVGSYTFIAAQCGLAGNSHVGSRCVLGGQIGINNLAGVGDDSRVAAQSGVTKMFPNGVELFGYPAGDRKTVMRQLVALRRLVT